MERAEKIIIASSLPRTGSAKGQTDTIVNAIKQRLEETNYQACNGQFTLEYKDFDDATAAAGNWDASQVAANANVIAANTDIMVLIGHFNSGAAKISMPVLNAVNLVMISPANTYPGLTKPGWNNNEPAVYYPTGTRNYTRVVPADDMQGVVAAYWAKQLGATAVYVIDDTDVYGKGVADTFHATAQKIDLKVLGQESMNPSASDYTALANKIIAAKADMVYFGGITQNNGGQLLKDLRNQGFTGKFMGPDAIYEQAFIDAAGPEAAEGTYVTFGALPPEKLAGKGAEWYQRYKAKYNSEPAVYAVYGYEAANVAIAALNKVCTKNRAAIRDAVFATKNFAGVLGMWNFDANGDTSLTSMSGAVVKGGKWRFDSVIGIN